MAQSVELLLDPPAEAAVRQEWTALAEAELPTEQRSQPSEHHRPHITLYAASELVPGAEAALAEVVAGLDLEVSIGSPLIFGPHRRSPGRFVLVRQVVPTVALLTLQQQVAAACGANRYGQFGPGRWSAHVTLARRATAQQVGAALERLSDGPAEDRAVQIRQCRRWDGTAKTAWLIS